MNCIDVLELTDGQTGVPGIVTSGGLNFFEGSIESIYKLDEQCLHKVSFWLVCLTNLMRDSKYIKGFFIIALDDSSKDGDESGEQVGDVQGSEIGHGA